MSGRSWGRGSSMEALGFRGSPRPGPDLLDPSLPASNSYMSG